MIIEKGIYFAKPELYDVIRAIGGKWNDSKERPIVCLIKIDTYDDIYWAIPMGDWAHRNEQAQKRIVSYIARKDSDIASCYYHIGRTTKKSIFFISDAIPITESYISREYRGYDKQGFVIKNPNLCAELERKLKRILYFESCNNNYFRQHITDTLNYLVSKQNKK